jgi:hypothetical protein
MQRAVTRRVALVIPIANPTLFCPPQSGQLQPPPDYIDHRIKIFEKLKAEYDEWVKGVCAMIITMSASEQLKFPYSSPTS